MNDLPFRSGATRLSQDQLLLLDFLALARMTIGLLYRDMYPQHMNVLYSHGVPDAELPAFLADMVHEGLLATTPNEDQAGEQLFGVARHGGDLWCRERLPVWRRYCCSTTSADAPDTMEVVCVDKNIGREFLAVSKASGWIPVVDDPDSVPWQAIPPDEVIEWHTLPSAWAATVRREPEETMDQIHERGDELERQRTWWWNVKELQKLVSAQGVQ
jgi:hypothetical protein